MHHADDQTGGRSNPGPNQRRYDSFVVRLWSDPDDAHRLARVEVQHVQTERTWEAQGVDQAEIAVAIGDLLLGPR